MTLQQAFTDWFEQSATLIGGSVSIGGVLWVSITLIVYSISLHVARKVNANPLANPVLVTAVVMGLLLYFSGTGVADYQQNAGLIHWLLGPATVALAMPMYAQWQKIRELGWRLLVAVGFAGFIAPLLAWLSVAMLRAPMPIQFTMLAKSITTPLAMEATSQIGGVPALAAVFVIITGIVGAIVAPLVYRLLNVTLPQAQGLALGAVCHAVGTAKALQMSQRTGALATLGLCLNGIITAILLPVLFG